MCQKVARGVLELLYFSLYIATRQFVLLRATRLWTVTDVPDWDPCCVRRGTSLKDYRFRDFVRAVVLRSSVCSLQPV